MTFYITYIKDVIGQNYLGIDIPSFVVDPYLNKLKDIIDNDDVYNEFVRNQQTRDHNHHHITVINPIDYNNLAKKHGMSNFINSIEPIFKYQIDDIKLLGIGTAEKGGNRTYFIVVDSEKVKIIRDKYELPIQDFHITIGFKWKDVFGVKKDKTSLIETKPIFLKLLGNLYYNNNEKWDFVKDLKGFEGNKEAEVIPLELTETQFIFKVDDKCMHVTCIGEDNQLAITCLYDVDKSKQRLSTTEI